MRCREVDFTLQFALHGVAQVEATLLPGLQPGLLFQVIDTGPGLRGKNYRKLFDPTSEMGALSHSEPVVTL